MDVPYFTEFSVILHCKNEQIVTRFWTIQWALFLFITR